MKNNNVLSLVRILVAGVLFMLVSPLFFLAPSTSVQHVTIPPTFVTSSSSGLTTAIGSQDQTRIGGGSISASAQNSSTSTSFGSYAALAGVLLLAFGLPKGRKKNVTSARAAAVAIAPSNDDGAIPKPTIRIGTRGSPLAMAQALQVKAMLAMAHPELALDGAVEIKAMSTAGDRLLNESLALNGGKGLFTRELDASLGHNDVDICVHSMKDVPTKLPDGMEIACVLKREDPRDAFICLQPGMKRLQDLPDGSVIGTSSLRRQAHVKQINPTFKCINFRGNVQTRLGKLAKKDVDATLLAYAGLKRMGMTEHATDLLELKDFLPACAQGAIGIQIRSDDYLMKKFLQPLHCSDTETAIKCERAFLAALDGNCRTPIAGHATVEDGVMHFKGQVFSVDGSQCFTRYTKGKVEDAVYIGRQAGEDIRKEAGDAFFVEMQEQAMKEAAANSRPVPTPTSNK